MASIAWAFSDDGSNVTGVSASHIFKTTGVFVVSMILTDSEGAVTTKQVTIIALEAAPVPAPAPEE